MVSVPGWPAELAAGEVTLRPLRSRDAGPLRELRERNVGWLQPWETTNPGSRFAVGGLGLYAAYISDLRRQARRGLALPWGVLYRGRLAGQLVVAPIIRGALNAGHAGYWVGREFAGRGIAPTALALAIDHCLGPARLHRVEVHIRPENHASRRVAEKLDLRSEGVRLRYLHIDGEYRDHLAYVCDVDDLPPGGMTTRWRQRSTTPR